jgi:hypothetical protein
VEEGNEIFIIFDFNVNLNKRQTNKPNTVGQISSSAKEIFLCFDEIWLDKTLIKRGRFTAEGLVTDINE